MRIVLTYLHQSCNALLEGNNIIGDAGGIGHDYAGGEALQVVSMMRLELIAALGELVACS